MKKIRVLRILAFVLVFGLALVGCGSGPDESPELTQIYVRKQADHNAGNFSPTTTIAAGDRYMIHYEGKNPYADLTGFRIITKRGATVIRDYEDIFDYNVPKSENFGFNTGTYIINEAGTYTIEVYVVDANGKKSNTKTVTLTVTQ